LGFPTFLSPRSGNFCNVFLSQLSFCFFLLAPRKLFFLAPPFVALLPNPLFFLLRLWDFDVFVPPFVFLAKDPFSVSIPHASCLLPQAVRCLFFPCLFFYRLLFCFFFFFFQRRPSFRLGFYFFPPVLPCQTWKPSAFFPVCKSRDGTCLGYEVAFFHPPPHVRLPQFL